MEVTSIHPSTQPFPAPRDAGAGVPDRPLLTYRDDATGERTQLTATTLGVWVARTANLLAVDCGLTPGARAAVLLPPHWQTAAILLGAWSTGVSVDVHSDAASGLARPAPTTAAPFDVSFATVDRLGYAPRARHRFVLGPGPAGVPGAAVPSGHRDYLRAVRGQPDDPRSCPVLHRTDAATVDGGSFGEWGAVARGLAAALDLRPGDRVLVDVSRTQHPLRWLLAPLAAGAAVVLCANLDPATTADRIRAERITRTL